MKIQPFEDRVLVKQAEKVTKQGTLFLPDTAQERPQQGEVIAVGKGKRTDDGTVVRLEVKVGDKILFTKNAGYDIRLGGLQYYIMKEDEILGVFGNGNKI